MFETRKIKFKDSKKIIAMHVPYSTNVIKENLVQLCTKVNLIESSQFSL